jgi:hypothetical protein
MQNPKYLLAAVAMGGLMLLQQPTLASPITGGLIGADTATSITTNLAEDVKQYKKHKYGKRRYHRHRRHHRRYRHHRRFYDDDDYYPNYSYYPYYCDPYNYYGSCGYPRRHRRPGFIIVSPYFSFGF